MRDKEPTTEYFFANCYKLYWFITERLEYEL